MSARFARFLLAVAVLWAFTTAVLVIFSVVFGSPWGTVAMFTYLAVVLAIAMLLRRADR